MAQPKVTILVPNYKTLKLTQLCLQLIRKHTPKNLAKIIVIDNNSQDDSLKYLRSLPWIDLIERSDAQLNIENPTRPHAEALDLGLAQVRTPYVLSIHTDTLVRHDQWLDFLIRQIEKDEAFAAVGSWKLESKPLVKRTLKQLERGLSHSFRSCCGKPPKVNQQQFLRSHCAMYKTDILKQHNLNFSLGTHEQSTGAQLHYRLVDLGYKMKFLPSETLGQYVDHLNHATMLLNDEFKIKQRDKGLKKLQRRMKQVNADTILSDVT